MARRGPTVADVAWSFFRAIEAAGAPYNSRIRYRSNMLAMLDQLGGRAITSITPTDLSRFVDSAPSTNVRASRRTVANHVMRHAHRRGDLRILVEVPAESYRPRAAKHREWTRYSAEQLRQLISNAPCERSRIAISTAIHTAMRIEDIRALRAPAPDLSEGWLASFIHKSGIYDFKVIANSFEDDMRRYLTWVYRRRNGVITGDDYLIPSYPASYRGGAYYDPDDATDFSRPMSKGTLDERYVEARARAGLPYLSRERWHTLRRSSGRLFFEAASDNGYDMALRMTQAFLNHASVTTTERYIGLDSAYAMRDDFLRRHDLLGIRGGEVIALRGREASR
jgi:integrase